MERRYPTPLRRSPYRWSGPGTRGSRARSWWVLAIGVPAALSLGVHTVLALAVRYYAWFETSPPRLTDIPVTETQLTFEPAPDPVAVPEPTPVPPAEVVPEFKPPEPVAEAEVTPPSIPSPAAEPIAAATDIKPANPTDLSLAPATQLPAPSPKQAITPKPVPTPVPTPAPTPPTVPAPAKATFAGVKADRAERVVYVVDASGAMTTSLTFVLDELSRSIGRLDESQQFQVILFREPPPSSGDAETQGSAGTENPGFEIFHPKGARAAGLLRANDTNKDAVRGWLRTVRPLGRSAPLPGLRAALTLKPQLVFLLTRSITRSGSTPQWGSGNAAVLKTLDELNPHDRVTGRRAVTVKTIQFLDDDPSGLLRSIAEQHGDGPGSYTLKTIGDLQ